ncbi:hypothetical protein QYM36_018661, partial [Artemia franciscana]
QGYAAAPERFNAVITYVINQTASRRIFGLKYGNRVFAECDFTDDIVLIYTSAAETLNTLR